MKRAFLFAMVLAGTAMGDGGELRQSVTRQEQIRGEAQQLVGRLDEVIAEYARNGLAKGPDFEMLKDVRASLASLSDDEMEQVVALLKEAEAGGGIAQMAKAYAGQKDISLRLKQILAAHERQQDIDALAREVRQLADRQSANLSTAIETKQLAAKDTSVIGQAAASASEQAQQGEQWAIAGEVKLLADKVAKIAADADDAKYKDAAAQLGQAQPKAVSATIALAKRNVDDAVTAETGAREQLEAVARALVPAQQQESGTNAAAGELADILKEQRALLDQTTQLNTWLKRALEAQTPEEMDKAMYAEIKQPGSPLAKRLAQSGITPASSAEQIRDAPEMKQYLAVRADALKAQAAVIEPQLTALAATQQALAAKAQMVREDLQKTVKEAAAPMANALTQMNSAQDALGQGDGDQATQDETDAASQLEQAERLAQQSGANTAQAQPPAGREQQLQQLQNGVRDLTAKENASVQQGDARKTGPMASAAAALQQNMAGKAEALRQAAQEQGSPAAPALQQAANALQNAAQAMTGGMPAQAEAAQQAALQGLGQAAQQLAQQTAAAAQEKQQLANAEREMAGLARVIQQQQQLDLDTEQAKGRVAQGKTKELTRRQAVVRKETQDLRQTINTATPEAAKPLDQADARMGDAAQKLSDASEEQAEPPQKAALAALYQAQDALADRAQALAQDVGRPPEPALANAEAELAKAQEEAGSAQQAMGQGGDAGMRNAAGELGQAERTVAQAAGQPQALSQDARNAMRQAEQALGEAAAAAAGGEHQQAQAQTGQARQAMSAAQAALGEAQAGIAGLTPAPGEGEPAAAQGKPGQSQGPGQPGSPGTTGKTAAKEQSWNDQAGAVTRGLAGAHGAGQFLGLPERDRAAIQQSESEKYPQEYGSMIEEYMRSLASDAGGK